MASSNRGPISGVTGPQEYGDGVSAAVGELDDSGLVADVG